MPHTLTAKHAIISDECRINHGNMEALFEAFRRLEGEYKELLKCHGVGKGVKFHVKLEVEFPLEAHDAR